MLGRLVIMGLCGALDTLAAQVSRSRADGPRRDPGCLCVHIEPHTPLATSHTGLGRRQGDTLAAALPAHRPLPLVRDSSRRLPRPPFPHGRRPRAQRSPLTPRCAPAPPRRLHCVAISGAMLALPRLLAALGQDPQLAAMVACYLTALLPSVWLEALSRCAPLLGQPVARRALSHDCCGAVQWLTHVRVLGRRPPQAAHAGAGGSRHSHAAGGGRGGVGPRWIAAAAAGAPEAAAAAAGAACWPS
jgi:hypothetical protein